MKNFLKRIFDYAIVCGLITVNPAHATPMRFITRARPLTRSLSPDELKIYMRLLYRSNIRRQFKLALHILLLTLVRKSELLQTRWTNVQLEEGEWLIPEAQSKTGKPHTHNLGTYSVGTPRPSRPEAELRPTLTVWPSVFIRFRLMIYQRDTFQAPLSACSIGSVAWRSARRLMSRKNTGTRIKT